MAGAIPWPMLAVDASERASRSFGLSRKGARMGICTVKTPHVRTLPRKISFWGIPPPAQLQPAEPWKPFRLGSAVLLQIRAAGRERTSLLFAWARSSQESLVPRSGICCESLALAVSLYMLRTKHCGLLRPDPYEA
ncbi:hypothetical protein VTN00DRAFT_3648 [Thermoascus crustaceus]|uniref:uncharacterized protein n=1 Tax=Thermoascus crustaceus TaxID=5088 RepID=UPI0037434A12